MVHWPSIFEVAVSFSVRTLGILVCRPGITAANRLGSRGPLRLAEELSPNLVNLLSYPRPFCVLMVLGFPCSALLLGIIYKSPETQALTTVPGLSDPPGFDGTEDCPRQLSHSIEWGLSRHLQIELLFLLRLRRLVRRMDQFYCSGFRILANFGFPIAHFPALSPSGEGLQSDAFAQVSS